MKKLTILLLFALFFNSFVFAQTAEKEQEKSKPTLNAELLRKVLTFDIEGKLYTDVEVYIKSSCSVSIYGNSASRVKVKVKDADGKIVYNKTMKNSYLYIFSDGQVQVGQPKFDKLVIWSDKISDKYIKGKIREKEGIY